MERVIKVSPPIEIPATPLSFFLSLAPSSNPYPRHALSLETYSASRDDGINTRRYDSVYLLITLQLRYCIPLEYNIERIVR